MAKAPHLAFEREEEAGVAKLEWGTKHICHSCGTRYYDMQRDPIVCPKCNTAFDPEAFLKSRRSRSAALEEVAEPEKKPAAKKPADDVEEVEEVDDEPDVEEIALEDEDEGKDDDIGSKKPLAASDDDEIVVDDDEDDDDTDVLLEDASELGDDDVIKIDEESDRD